MKGIYVVGAVIGVISALVAATIRRGGFALDLSRLGSNPREDEIIAMEGQTRAELASLRHEVLSRLDDLRSQLPKGTEQPRIENEMGRIRSDVETMQHELLARLDALRSEVGSHEHVEHAKTRTRRPTRPEGKSAESHEPGH